MRRLVAIFLLVLLPLQFSWAAVNAYCEHQIEHKTAPYSSCHADEHAQISADEGGNQSESPNFAEEPHNHHHHHGGNLGILTSTSLLPTYVSQGVQLKSADIPDLSNAYRDRIERPNWFYFA